MTGPLGGPGLGLQLPQYLYPSELFNAPADTSNNQISLNAGDVWNVPRGDWLIDPGIYGIIQFFDPVNGSWDVPPSAAWNSGMQLISSDGFSARVANMLGCPLSAVVSALGTGTYVQSSTTITPTPSGSTWAPLIGGALAVSGGTLVANGAGYGVAPILLIQAPPGPSNNPNGVGGIQASGYCTIANGTVSGVTLTNPGAGYPTAPSAFIIPNPTDPNITTGITAASVAFTLTNTGSLTGAICTNPGPPLSNPNQLTLSVTGAGSSASLTGNVLQTVTAASVSGGGAGYGTQSALLTTVGGVPTTGSILNPFSLGLAWRPRPAQVGLTVTAATGSLAAQLGTIYDGGLFLTSTAPTPVIITQPLTGTGTVTSATLALTMGNRPIVIRAMALKT